MKKNKMMRLASSLLVAVLLTSSVISGTFAKYVTEGHAEDEARVAKWGVVIESDGYLFADTYKRTVNTPQIGGTDGATLSVMSFGGMGDNVVAPGTKNLDDGLTFKISGTPEVAVAINIAVTGYNGTGEPKDIFLSGSDLPNMTTQDKGDTFTLDNPYVPVRFNITKDGSPVKTSIDLTELNSYFEGLSTEYINAKTDLNTFGTYTITWEWEYSVNDMADTLLGNLAANKAMVDAEKTLTDQNDYNLETGLQIQITVTQVD